MTIPGLGKLTPIQMQMIALGGQLLREFMPDAKGKSFSDIERLWSMKRAHTMLCLITGQDYGFELENWHNYLVHTDENYGYNHPYGWEQTKSIVERRILDPELKKLAAKASSLDNETGWFRTNSPSYEQLHPQIRQMIANLRGQFDTSDKDNYLDSESAYNILVAMTGINCGHDADMWVSVLVSQNAT